MASSPDQNLFSALGRTVVLVADADAALVFYRDILGFSILHDQTAGGDRYLHVGLSGQAQAGLWLMPATTARERELIGRQCGGQPLLVLYTDDVQQIGNHLRAHGVRVWDEREDADSRSLHFEDLYGTSWSRRNCPSDDGRRSAGRRLDHRIQRGCGSCGDAEPVGRALSPQERSRRTTVQRRR
ncbi:VOC family protein [Streptomyces sp. ISL-98]|uniref:VOC family protein n=1 Tax=Streptomyces sp. ISL-98 TaxID=2819192 RepID=UPI001BE79867|nr:VOC family protein [Streptomyces sp. ISL-98]MBT2510168.1 VOC family protein [Streptomyces sp. ISL-98]